MSDSPGLLQALLKGSSAIPHAFNTPSWSREHPSGVPQFEATSESAQFNSHVSPKASQPSQVQQTASSRLSQLNFLDSQTSSKPPPPYPSFHGSQKYISATAKHSQLNSLDSQTTSQPPPYSSFKWSKKHMKATSKPSQPNSLNSQIASQPTHLGFQWLQKHMTETSQLPEHNSLNSKTVPYPHQLAYRWQQTYPVSTLKPSEFNSHCNSQTVSHQPHPPFQWPQTYTAATSKPSELNFLDSQRVPPPFQHSFQWPRNMGAASTNRLPGKFSSHDSQTVLQPPHDSQTVSQLPHESQTVSQPPHIRLQWPQLHVEPQAVQPFKSSFSDLQSVSCHLHPLKNISGIYYSDFDEFQRNRKRHRLVFKRQKPRLSHREHVHRRSRKCDIQHHKVQKQSDYNHRESEVVSDREIAHRLSRKCDIQCDIQHQNVQKQFTGKSDCDKGLMKLPDDHYHKVSKTVSDRENVHRLSRKCNIKRHKVQIHSTEKSDCDKDIMKHPEDYNHKESKTVSDRVNVHRLSHQGYILEVRHHKEHRHFPGKPDCDGDSAKLPDQHNPHKSKVDLDRIKVLRDHSYAKQQEHSEDITYVECTYCGDVMDMYILKKHLEAKHQQNASKCFICQKEYFFANSLLQHLESHGVHTGDKVSLAAKEANSALQTQKEWKVVHKSTKTVCPEPDETFKCKYCSKLIPLSQLSGHLTETHQCEVVEAFVCFICNTEFKTGDEVAEHIKIHRDYIVKSLSRKPRGNRSAPLGPKELQVEKTNTFSLNKGATNSELGESIRQPQMESRELDFQCCICDAVYSSVEGFMEHMACHTFYKVNSVTESPWFFLLKRKPVTKKTPKQHRATHQIEAVDHSKDTGMESQMPNQGANKISGESVYQNKGPTTNSNMNSECSNQEENKLNRTYMCDICFKVFKNRTLYIMHVTNAHIRETDSIGHKCTVCLQVFPTAKSLREHYQSVHSEMYHTCSACAQSYFGIGALRVHLQKCHPELVHTIPAFSCCYCDTGFPSAVQLGAHRVAKHVQFLHKCPKCDKAFMRKTLLERHIGRHKLPDHICNICGEVFPSTHFYNIHRVAAHTKKWFKCQICEEKKFHLRAEYDRHMATHRPKKKRTWKAEKKNKCRSCGEQFSNSEELTKHRSKNHVRTKVCEICGKELSANSYKMHMKRHRQELDHQCEFCGKKFLLKIELTNHQAIHHEVAERKFHKCDLCGKEYSKKDSLQRHILRHEGKVDPRAQCTICGKQLNNTAALKDHVRIHTGEKPFKCRICGKGFAKKCNMMDHERVHSGTQRKRGLKKDDETKKDSVVCDLVK